MIHITDFKGQAHYLATQNIASVTEAGVSSRWHGIRAFVRTYDGLTIEASQEAEHIAALIATSAQAGRYAERYAWMRDRDLSTIHQGGVFAGKTPENVVLNGDDLDAAIDAQIEVGRNG
ncbi:MAG: hypothetical protein K2X78_02855 [Burkholderiaceae bacterium]|nr:hypothetical protein [Burkholderiaceae bacterium]